ncbi:Endonuclease/exonuclease/phosphatase [Leucosporidium creatinivorum]|uniref:DNA-(apurinic or apyrimidinic site) endonuclease n=1 Tax=Leucosporidium creatinivorum TaxID=106004 RepID=A0A1Y2DJN0_9BASI|nr:Endonuclease/exonuclease/phosphatase [Leucosporidium creatinivorum]
MPTRFLVFDEPPRSEYCVAVQDGRAAHSYTVREEDYTFQAALSTFKRPPSPRPAPIPPPDSQLFDHDTSAEDHYATFGPGQTGDWGEEEEEEEQEDATGDFRAAGQGTRTDDGTEDMDLVDSRLHGFLPPPTQDPHALSQLRSQHHFQSQSRTFDISARPETQPTFLGSQEMSMVSVGAPPRFDWHKWDLVRFDNLRGLLQNKPRGGKQLKVSVLAVIMDIRPMREVGAGKHVAEWDLEDPTGQIVKFSLWGSGGDELSSHVRREDVVWIGDCRLSEYQGRLQLSATYTSGQGKPDRWGLQVCWRGNVVTDDDHQHRFHEGFRDQGLFSTPLQPLLPLRLRPFTRPITVMPPKASKRKVDVDSDAEVSSHSESEQIKKPAAKKSKAKEPVKPLDASLPHNTTFPKDLQPFPTKAEGSVRLSAWNVCGIKACDKKGFRSYLEAEDADIIILTETKSVDPQIKELDDRYEHRYWGTDPKKGYAGTAVLSKIKPVSVVFGLPGTKEPQANSAGRCVTLEFENSYVVGTYVPNAGAKLANLDKKEAWNEAFEAYLRELDAKKAVIWGGDLNVVPTETDVRNWKTNYNKTAGATQQEIDGFEKQLNPSAESGHKPLKDAWRQLHPDAVGYYTYFSARFQCREKGIGWRLDSFVVSERLMEKVKQCEIRLEIYGASDHVPVVLDIEGPL